MKTPIIIDADVMMRLSDENQEKVVNIYHIAAILEHHNCPPLTWENFVDLYDSPLDLLEQHTNAKAEKFNVSTPDMRIRNTCPHPAARTTRPQQREYPEDCD